MVLAFRRASCRDRAEAVGRVNSVTCICRQFVVAGQLVNPALRNVGRTALAEHDPGRIRVAGASRSARRFVPDRIDGTTSAPLPLMVVPDLPALGKSPSPPSAREGEQSLFGGTATLSLVPNLPPGHRNIRGRPKAAL